MGGVVEADPVWHRPVGPSQPFRAGDSPTPKGGMLHSVTGGGEGVAGPSSMLSTTRQIVVKRTPRDSVRVCVPLVVQCASHCTVACGKILVALPAAGLRVPLWSQRAFLSQRDEERLERRAAPGSSSSLKQRGTKFFLHLNTG